MNELKGWARINYRWRYIKPLKCNILNRLPFPLGKCNIYDTCYTCTHMVKSLGLMQWLQLKETPTH